MLNELQRQDNITTIEWTPGRSTAPALRHVQAEPDLLTALWPDPDRDGCITFWMSNRRSIHVPVRALPLSAADMADLRKYVDEHKLDLYFGLGARKDGLSEKQQGGKKDITWLPGFVIDIDFLSPKAHKATNLPKDLDEAAETILKGMPDPSIIVHTGNGVHLYYLFDHPIAITNANRKQVGAAYRKWQKPFIEQGKEHGFQVDSTSTLQRVWRLPGFLNRKTDKPVELLYCDPDKRYAPMELGVHASAAPTTRSVAAATLCDGEETTAMERRPLQYADVDIDNIKAALGGTQNQWSPAIKKALAGESMAEPGNRDITLQGVCSALSWLPEGRNADPAQLAEVLRESLQVWADEPGADKTIEEELAKAADKIERSQEDWRVKQAHKQPAIDALARKAGLIGKDGLDSQGTKPSQDHILRYAVIQKGRTYYAWDFRRQRYSQALSTKDELRGYTNRAWENSPIELHYHKKDGSKVRVQFQTLLDRHLHVCKAIVADLTSSHSRYEASEETFYEAVAPLRVTPRRDDEISKWLLLLGGDNSDKLLDWLAGSSRLDEQSAILYLEGPPGAGKGLLALGVSGQWTTGGPSEYQQIAGTFNSDISECPVVLIDEAMPMSKKGSSGDIRRLTGSSSITINAKYQAHKKTKGAVRMIIAANNDEVLTFDDENMSQDDIAALIARVLHIKVSDAAAKWLAQRNANQRLTRKWVSEDLLARHILWLGRNREIKRGKRFLVEGVETQLHRKLMTHQGRDAGLVREWIVRYATKPATLEKRYRTTHDVCRALLREDKVLVNTQGAVDCWDAYMPRGSRVPDTSAIVQVLRNLSGRRITRPQQAPGVTRPEYYIIEGTFVVESAREMQIGDVDQIIENLRAAAK